MRVFRMVGCAALVIVAAAGFSAQREIIVGGKVLDAEGNPIARAKIIMQRLDIIEEEPPAEATTNEEGVFRMPEVLADSRYLVRVEKEGYLVQERTIGFESSRMVHEADFTLQRADRALAREAYARGYEAYQAGRVEEAAAAMEGAVATFGATDRPDDVLIGALVALGQVRLRLGEFDGAGSAFERVIALNPDNAFARMGLGTVLDQQGELVEAIEQFRAVVELEPTNAMALYNLGSLLLTAEDVEQAITVLERCLELQPNLAQAHRSLGSAYAQSGDNARAIEHLEAYLELAPDAPDAEQVRTVIENLRG